MSEDSGTRLKLAILIVISATAGLVIAGFIGGYLQPGLTTIASIVTILLGVRTGYGYLRNQDWTVSDPDEVDYGLLSYPGIRDLREDQEFAFELLEDDEWRQDGYVNPNEAVRKLLYRLFHKTDFSNTKAELILLGVTSVSLALFAIVFIELLAGTTFSPNYFQVIAQVYPDEFGIRSTPIPLIISILGLITGSGYFGWKKSTTCPNGTPFSLEDLGRYYRPDDLKQETRIKEGDEISVTVAYGYSVFFCHQHHRYFVRELDWIRTSND